MPRTSQVVLYVALIAVLIAMFAGGSVGPPRRGDSGSPGLLWPLAAAVCMAAILLLQELRSGSARDGVPGGQLALEAPPASAARPANRRTRLVPVGSGGAQEPTGPPLPLTNFGTDRDAQPASGFDYALGDSFTSGGRPIGEPQAHRSPFATKEDVERALADAIEAAEAGLPQLSPVSPHRQHDYSELPCRALLRRTGAMSASKVGAMQKLMVEELEAVVMEGVVDRASVFHAWRAEVTLLRGTRHFDNLGKGKKDDFDKLRAQEQERFDAEAQVLEERNALLRKKWGQKISLFITQWAHGDTVGLYVEMFRVWHQLRQREKMIRQEMRCTQKVSKSAVGVLLRMLEGDAWGGAHACLLQWKGHAARSLADRVHERKMRGAQSQFDEEHRRFEKMIQDQSRSHENDVQALKSETELLLDRAHKVTELMLAKWMGGDKGGLLHTVFADWRSYVVETNTLQAQRQSVHDSMLRFLEGDRRAAAHLCFLNWKNWTREELLYKNEVAEHQRKIAQLQESTKAYLGTERDRLLQCAAMLGEQDNNCLKRMVLTAWCLESKGMKAADLHRRQEAAVEEAKRLHELAVTKHRHHHAAVLHCLGMKDDCIVLLDAFSAWAQIYQAKRQAWAHSLVQSEAAEKYAGYILAQMMEKDDASLLAAIFWEFTRELHRELRAKERVRRQEERDEMEITLKRIRENDMNRLEEELRMAYAQIDKITEQLTAELQTKEELARELHDACLKLREQSILMNARYEEETIIEEVRIRRSSRQDRDS
eukprot:TRINITY_DN23646_c0_g1_i1.p1 TRINITY_DN23646_c0_g1~~TRINITY_DN23646_c0_g1_i1.p1  ORF type:complete len:768 (+),score=155.61 TRINITY_DN23646_c0_g1_i1:120-2423(+)